MSPSVEAFSETHVCGTSTARSGGALSFWTQESDNKRSGKNIKLFFK